MKSSGRRLLMASTNQKKLKELQDLLADVPFELLSLRDFPGVKDVVEDRNTFLENARKKALSFARQTGCLTLADDSGLTVDCLDGAPGVYSARYAGPEKNDLRNCEKLLKALEGVPNGKRGAAFQCAIALASPEQVFATVEEDVRGRVAHQMKGRGGFGYDPLFFYPEFGKTFAEIPSSQKHLVSHRGKALRKVKEILKGYLESQTILGS
ncbi:MAG: non-canonical purine NTP pyrophosphatase, RdgB/HAM1 family [Omnitrophica bacterium RIFCSPLOWO2_12_FULL_50_11]|nr:MAG: non-canonical purine NTP pyrophosphatase, RdgB/HAM1 family [Omnitrophica bacterium RIFCSPLOWO2_12_FULL_50_11]